MSRVPEYEKKDVLMNFRISQTEKDVWQTEAERQDVPLSRMIRHIVNKYCLRRKKKKK